MSTYDDYVAAQEALRAARWNRVKNAFSAHPGMSSAEAYNAVQAAKAAKNNAGDAYYADNQARIAAEREQRLAATQAQQAENAAAAEAAREENRTWRQRNPQWWRALDGMASPTIGGVLPEYAREPLHNLGAGLAGKVQPAKPVRKAAPIPSLPVLSDDIVIDEEIPVVGDEIVLTEDAPLQADLTQNGFHGVDWSQFTNPELRRARRNVRKAGFLDNDASYNWSSDAAGNFTKDTSALGGDTFRKQLRYAIRQNRKG